MGALTCKGSGPILARALLMETLEMRTGSLKRGAWARPCAMAAKTSSYDASGYKLNATV